MRGSAFLRPLGLFLVAHVVCGTATAEPLTRFTANSSCYDASRQNAQAHISCVACSAFYDNGGNTMADAAVSVTGSPGADGSLIDCDSDHGGITALVGAAATVRAQGPPGAVVPLQVTYAISVTGSPNCSVSATAGLGDERVAQERPGARSGTLKASAGSGQGILVDIAASVSCGGCRYRDTPAGREFFDCSNDGEAIVDPTFAIDANWPHADLFVLEAFDSASQTWAAVVPPDLDQDDDGFEQPDDCNDFDPDVYPGAPEIELNGTDDDCSGGDRIPGGAAPGTACLDDVECESGACVVGICCETRCGDGSPDDCQACTEAETGMPDGLCGVLAAGTVCRPSDGACDTAEVCDGMAPSCNGDFRLWAGDVCRPSANACDPAETCVMESDANGSTTVCPDDVYAEVPSDEGDPCDTGMAGQCGAGIRRCGACGPAVVAAETCNGGDDDCDGIADEGYEFGFCFDGVGACQAGGAFVCDADGGGTHCEAATPAPAPEGCNGQDDDCDGATDEDWDVGGPCTSGVGSCARPGTLQCSVFDPGGPAQCDAQPGEPQAETCNDQDDDCDGITDEGGCQAMPAPDAFAAMMDTALDVAAPGVLANDELIGAVIAVLDAQPDGGVVALEPDGAFTFIPDACVSGAVSFSYHLHDPVADVDSVSATVTIDVAVRPTTFAFTASAATIGEGQPGALTVARSGACGVASVTAYTQANTASTADVANQTTVLQFAAGEREKTFHFATLDDFTVEGTESFYVRLRSPSAGATLAAARLAVVTLLDDDDAGTFELTGATQVRGEGAGEVTLDIVRHGATAGTSASVRWAAASGSAGAADFAYLAGDTRVVTFGPGESARSITLALTDDVAVEGVETFRVALSSPSAGSRLGDVRQTVVSLEDDDDAGVIEWAAVATDVGEAAGSVSLEITRTGGSPGTGASVRWAASAGSAGASDFAVRADDPRLVVFAPDETSRTITIDVAQDALVEGIESFRVALSAPSTGARLGARRNADVLIRDDDAVSEVALESAVLSGGEGDSVVARVVRTNPAGAASVAIRTTASVATSPADFTAAGPVVLAFEAGQSEAWVEIQLGDDGLVEGDEALNVTLSSPVQAVLAAPQRSVLILRDDD